MPKVKIKDTVVLVSLLLNLDIIINFEQVNAGWVVSC